jgi:hypothetical protein
MIGERFNFEDVFFRDLTVCVLDTLEGQIRWVNRFSSGDVPVNVPFYYSLTGDERFLLDSFQDDIVSENRFIELNTDIIPRGHLTMTGFNIKSDDFANPNVWLRMVVENEIEIRKVLAKVRAIPITVNYELSIKLSNEIDTFKCSQAIMDTLWIYKFMYFEHNFMNIDAVILMPDSNQIEMSREKNLTSDNNIELKVSFTVETYYPAFRKDRVNATGYPRYYGSGMTDLNGFSLSGGFSDFFDQPNNTNGGANGGNAYDYIGNVGDPLNPGSNNGQSSVANSIGAPSSYNSIGGSEYGINGNSHSNYGTTGSFFSNSTGNPFGPGAAQVIGANGQYTNDPDYYMIAPKRTRWFNNILRAREKASGNINNPNSQSPSSGNEGSSNPPINPNPI